MIKRALLYGTIVSGGLAVATLCNQDNILLKLTKTPEVRAAAASIMPMVLLTQIFKGLAYSTGGVLLGGLDWFNSSAGMSIASLVTIVLLQFFLPNSLWNIWVGLAVFMATQVVVAMLRLISATGPWVGLDLFNFDRDRKGEGKRGATSSTPALPQLTL